MDIIDLPEDKRLIQLAEESAELAQAALKAIRAVNGDTPVTIREARERLLEEIADVRVCCDVIVTETERAKGRAICQRKRKRWSDRINV